MREMPPSVRLIDSSRHFQRQELKKVANAHSPAWKNVLDKKGFKFTGVTKMWHAPAGTDTDELEAMMEEYGFAVDTYDTAEVHTDEEDAN